MLKDSDYNYDIKENQSELTKFQLNRLSNALRKKFLEQELQEEWFNQFKIIKRLEFEDYYEDLQLRLSSKRQFREDFLRDFQKAIEFVFELIKAKQKVSELKGFKKEIADDLMKRFGFLEDMKQRGNFEILLSIFISRYIYDTIKDPKFEYVMGAYDGELTLSQIDKLTLSIQKAVSCQQINDDWLISFNRFKKRKFSKNYERLQQYILTDQLYRITFFDYLKYLIKLVDGLINGKNNDSELNETELIVARDLRRGDPFQNLGEPNALFKLNLIIVLGRIVYLTAKVMESSPQSHENKISSLELETDRILNLLMQQITTKNKINNEFLKKLYKIKKEDFEKAYEKIKSSMKSDQIYYEQFSFYLKWIIETILNILSGVKSESQLSIYEKAIVRDLKNFSFNGLITDSNVETEVLSVVSQIQKGELKKTRNLRNRPPWEILSHYYEDAKKCKSTISKYTKFIRHNYFISSRLENKLFLKCKHCEVSLSTDILDWLQPHKRVKLTIEEKAKNIGDITVYRVLIKKVNSKDGTVKWLSFPGINYIGIAGERLSGRSAKDRLEDHIKNAFAKDRKKQIFEQYIANLYETKANFQKNFAKGNIKLEIMIIVKFQGDLNSIRNIQDTSQRKIALQDATKKTDDLAGYYEKMLIGFYHSQFDEFGKNIHEGGRFEKGIGLAYDPFEVDKLFRQGYLPYDIVKKIGVKGELVDAGKLVIGYIEKYLYSDIFYPNGLENPRIRFRDARRIIFKEIIENLVKEGYKTYEDMLEVLPGFENTKGKGKDRWHELKRITIQTHGGIEKLLEKYYPKDTDLYCKAIALIKKNRRQYSSKQLCVDLGFVEEYGYTISSLEKNSGRYIKNHIGFSFNQLRNEAFKLKDKTDYISKAIELIKEYYIRNIYISPGQRRYISASDLAIKLNLHIDNNLSEKYVRDHASNLIYKACGISYEKLKKQAIS